VSAPHPDEGLVFWRLAGTTEPKEILGAEMQTPGVEMKTGSDRLEAKLDRMAETLSTMLTDHEQRIRTIERERH
jgi:hypothetical protein